MKRIIFIGVAIAALSFLGGLTVPALAHGPEDGDTSLAGQETWEAMHEACEDGDWEAMTEVAEEVHGEDFDSMPCHDEGDYSSFDGWGGTGGHMGGGMM